MNNSKIYQSIIDEAWAKGFYTQQEIEKTQDWVDENWGDVCCCHINPPCKLCETMPEMFADVI